MKNFLRIGVFICIDIILLLLSIILSYMTRFDWILPLDYLKVIIDKIPFIILTKISVFYVFRLYNTMWKYASIYELFQIVLSGIISNALIITYLVLSNVSVPRSIMLLMIVFDILLVGGFRIMYRIYSKVKDRNALSREEKLKNIMIVGAGDAGAMVIKEYSNHADIGGKPVVIVDDNLSKQGKVINGVRVDGTHSSILQLSKDYKIDEIIIAIPSASRKEISKIINECKKTTARIKILPGIYEIIDGKVSVSSIREVNIEDLLGRDQVKLDTEAVNKFLHGKIIAVSGAVGTIGSELVRQIAVFNPKKLVLFDINENGLHQLQQELNYKFNDKNKTLDFDVLVASIRDKSRLEEIFEIYKPQVVFHAAAHKHVPMMEWSPKEAIKNNVFGTLNLVQVSDKYGVEKFVQISTDKAVNPTNVMGATKRLCEMIIQSYDKNSKTEYAAVRFGNVLGSSGSVIPTFKEQIARGGPITLTHPDIIRYFMMIPEAAQLVLQAGALANGGEIFVLEMGEPVKIMDLAKDMIRLSGLIPYEDIDIEIIGLRPGEKLYEELLMSEEGLNQTAHEKIHVGRPTFTSIDELNEVLEVLKEVYTGLKDDEVRGLLKKAVPTFNPK